ncbi:DUF4097 domain-containing protein [Aliifodinibius sp. S!AR15-10]|uniref:DUF4097 family beta strand repeat-containing protein n=1 Tax=Aliifodinibius sp. S!AR15-10 TaxID=2950437 RepID=UPI002866B4FA|nr:DUF4097 family beta strand repeat-containing protein [Aliifodinibius sp. S!AR15-10]MDR8393163.1 DUF4097 domain-containing protein [Aliifodinibius sp. S!AR15-10]
MTARNIYITKVLAAFGLALLISFLMVLSATAKSNATNTNIDDPYRIEEFNISTPGELEVKTSGGHITVEASETNTVRVEMYVQRNGRDLSPSDTDLDDFDIDISQSGDKVTAIAERRGKVWNWGRNNISVSFVVYTPREMKTDLRTSGGHIAASGLDGDQRLSTSGGHLEMTTLKGTVDARTSGGHIEIRDFSGQMDARTSGGHIEAENAEGRINLRTSGGHISLRDLSGSVEASTSGGSIEADLNSIEDFVDLRTSGGHINISVPDGIALNLDLKGNRVSTKLSNFTGEVERDEVHGSINGGGPKLTARTSGGSVRITYN